MKILIILVDEQNGKWGWSVRGKGFSSGGIDTAKTKDEAEQQAKGFVEVLVKTEKVNMETAAIIIREAIRDKE